MTKKAEFRPEEIIGPYAKRQVYPDCGFWFAAAPVKAPLGGAINGCRRMAGENATSSHSRFGSVIECQEGGPSLLRPR